MGCEPLGVGNCLQGREAVKPRLDWYSGMWRTSGHYRYAIRDGTARFDGYLLPGTLGLIVDGAAGPLVQSQEKGGALIHLCSGATTSELARPLVQPEGLVRVTVADGYTHMGWWDRSGDPRHGSYSIITAAGRWTFTEMLAALREQFPALLERQRGDLREDPSPVAVLR